MQEELAEMTKRHRNKVAQWENSQEALDQLTDELEANRNLLMESRQTESHLRGQTRVLQEQVETLKQQVQEHVMGPHLHTPSRLRVNIWSYSFLRV